MSDDSQKKWVRKAVLGIEPVFVKNRDISAPVIKCEEKNCVPHGVFNYSLSQQEIDYMSWYIYEWLITPRYDKITVGNKTAVITTKTDQIAFNLPNQLYFKTSSAESFKDDVEQYSTVMNKILNATIKERYAELPEKEQETFIVSKAKELGLEKEFVSVLMNSAFIFAVNVNSISASGKISKIEPKEIKGLPGVPPVGAPGGFSLSFQIDIKADVMVYKYDPEKRNFSHYKTIKARSGGFLLNMMGLGAGAFDSRVFPAEPSLNSIEAQEVFKNSFSSAVKALGISGNYELKKDDNFAIFAPVTEVDGSNVFAECGVGEDIRVDHPMAIQQYKDGEVNVVGYVKARKIGKNCTDKVNNPTRFRKIKGNAEEGDQLREHPWTGLMFSFGGGVRDFGFSFLEDSKRINLGGIMGGGQLGFSMDLGYATNLRFFSETWLYMGGYFYAGGVWPLGRYEVPLTGGFHFNLSHRIHFTGGGAFFAPQFSMLYTGGSSKASAGNINQGDLSFGALSLEPGLQLGFSFTPNVEMIFYGGYQFPVYGALEKNDIDITSISRAKFNHGFVASLNFQIHMPVVGATAAIYSNPSKDCRKKQKEKSEDQPASESLKPPHPERPLPQSDADDRKNNQGSQLKKAAAPRPVPLFDETAIKGIDLLGVDADVMIAYDEAVNVEKREDIIDNPKEAITAWKKLVDMKSDNPFLSIGQDRLKIWLTYYRSINETLEKNKKAKESIKKMLPLSSISVDQKRDAVIKYIETYSVDEGLEIILDILLKTVEKSVSDEILGDATFKKTSRNVIMTRCEKGNGKECYVYSTFFPENSKEFKEYLVLSCKLEYEKACDVIKEIVKKREEEKRAVELEKRKRIEEENKRKREEEETRRVKEAEENRKTAEIERKKEEAEIERMRQIREEKEALLKQQRLQEEELLERSRIEEEKKKELVLREQQAAREKENQKFSVVFFPIFTGTVLDETEEMININRSLLSKLKDFENFTIVKGSLQKTMETNCKNYGCYKSSAESFNSDLFVISQIKTLKDKEGDYLVLRVYNIKGSESSFTETVIGLESMDEVEMLARKGFEILLKKYRKEMSK